MHLSSLKSFDWDSPVFLLSLLALLLFTYSAVRSAGMKPMQLLTRLWQRMRQRFKALNFAWLGAGARTRRILVNCGMVILGFFIGYSWKTHQYAAELRSQIELEREKAKQLEKWKHDYAAYQQILTAWVQKHKEIDK